MKDINSFTRQYPRQLIILDISHQMDLTKVLRDLSPKKREKVFEEMNKAEALWVPLSSDIGNDLFLLRLSAVTTPGSKAVISVRLSDDAPLPGTDSNP